MSEIAKTIRKAFGSWWFGVVVLLLVVGVCINNGWLSVGMIEALAASAVGVIQALVPDGLAL